MADMDDDVGSSGGSSASRSEKSKGSSKTSRALTAAGKQMQSYGQDQLRKVQEETSRPVSAPESPRYVDVPSLRKGGRLKKGGVAQLHRGETVKHWSQRKGKRGKKGRSGGGR